LPPRGIGDRILTMAESKTVIVMLDPLRMFTKGLLQGIGRYVRANHAHWTFFRPSNFRHDLRTKSIVEMVRRLGADGVVVRQDEDIEGLIRAGIPAVTTNYTGKRLAGVANIAGDMTAIGKAGAAHLLERGFRNFAFCGYTDRDWSGKRQRSFVTATSQAGYRAAVYTSDESVDADEWTHDLESLADWLAELPRPLGIMACNDDRGEQVIEACRVAGLRVPDDVAVVGVDNDPGVCNFSNPRLSSVVLNVEDAGYHAAGLLAGWMAGRQRSFAAVSVKPVRIATRESSDVVATEDQQVSAAMRFIRENASRAIQVGEVVEHAGISRRNLETRFRSVLGASVLERIRSARVDQAIVMLTDTDVPISRIAGSLGYPGAPQFSRYFRQGTGMSPGEYRQQYGSR
jgi:LacI family transcriptional regulator